MWCHMSKNFNKQNITILSIVVIVIIVTVSIFNYNYSSFVIKEKYSFSEVSDINFALTKKEKSNINNILDILCVEDNNYLGFSGGLSTAVNLYTANSLVNLAKIVPDYDLAIAREKLTFLSTMNLNNLDFLNLTYYIELCKNLNFEINYAIVNNKLLKYYDTKTNLFFVDNSEDSINTKIVATSVVKRVLGENLSSKMFSPETGIHNTFSNYVFKTNTDITFFNSGGDILSCVETFGMNEIINTTELRSWYLYWKNLHEAIVVNSDISALQYSDFLDIAKIFESDYSTNKLQDYYNSISIESINQTGDLLVMYNTFKNVTLNNSKVNGAIKSEIYNTLNSETLVTSHIDIKLSVFGVLLALKTDFTMNDEKLKEYIKHNYAINSSIENNYERASALYYNLILDQLVNGYEQEYNASFFQSEINKVLSSLEYDETITADVVSTRRIVEIISDLQMFDVKISLSYFQKSKINKGLKKSLDNSTIRNSVLLNDIYIVDKALSLNIISEKELAELYNSLTQNGGTCAVLHSDTVPDICSTYQFMITFNRNNNYNELKKQREFVDTLKLSDGVYALDKKSYDTMDLPAITYGNAIRYLEFGEDKFD